MPTAVEIRSAEAYLAQKWGIETYAEGKAGGCVRLYGAGAAEAVVGETKLGGSFKGTMTVAAGATLKLTDILTIPTNAAALEAGGTAAIRHDPDRTDLLVFNSAPPSGVDPLVNADNDSLYSLQNVLNSSYKTLYGAGRGAALVRNSQFADSWGWGPDRLWLAYATKWTQGRVLKSSGTAVNSGNTSRFDDNYSGSGKTYDVRTLFMVLDTSAGGGTPFLDTDVTSPAYVKVRANAAAPVFTVLNGHAFVTNSPAYLNGVAIKSGERAFNGRAELLSCCFSEIIPLKCFGSWSQTGETCDLRHGEVILYRNELTDAERRETEAYLMNKWLGIAPSGYGDLSGMTVDGAGEVQAASGTIRPKFAETFSGVFDVTSVGTVSFTAGADAQIADAIEVPGGTLALPENVTLRVTVQDGSLPPDGSVTLVSASTLTGADTVAFEMVPAKYQSQYIVLKQDAKLILSRRHSGMIISVR